jgi:hypothetical protein
MQQEGVVEKVIDEGESAEVLDPFRFLLYDIASSEE